MNAISWIVKKHLSLSKTKIQMPNGRVNKSTTPKKISICLSQKNQSTNLDPFWSKRQADIHINQFTVPIFPNNPFPISLQIRFSPFIQNTNIQIQFLFGKSNWTILPPNEMHFSGENRD